MGTMGPSKKKINCNYGICFIKILDLKKILIHSPLTFREVFVKYHLHSDGICDYKTEQAIKAFVP